MLTRFAKEWFGDFDRQELKKFIFLGVIFGFIIGIYWVLKPVKNSVFMSMVGAKKIGHVKIFSLLALFPLVMILGKLMDMFPPTPYFIRARDYLFSHNPRIRISLS